MAGPGGIIQPLTDTSELVELFKPLNLYLKPVARMNISVKLPLLKDPGQSISNWDLMERLKKLIFPFHFSSIKVSKSTMEFVRFEAEVNNKEILTKAIKILDNSNLKVIGFYETLKVRAAEAKSEFPNRHDWDAFFRDAKNMNELHPGERPDTIYLAYLPCKWFFDSRQIQEKETGGKDLPSEFILRRIFETFGEVRCVDIPMVDPYRAQMSKTGMRSTGFRFGGEVTFEGYVQFNEYISFVKAMDTLRNMKLVHIDSDGKASAANIKVDFDKSKHLADKSIRRRRLERERLVRIENERKAIEEAERARLEAEEAAVQKVKSDRRRQREEKRRIKHLERKRLEEERAIERKILLEERKLVVAERKLESVRLLSDLFERVKEMKQKDEVSKQEKDLEEILIKEQEKKEQLKSEEAQRRERLLKRHEKELRKKVTKRYKDKEKKWEEYFEDESRKQPRPEDSLSAAASSKYRYTDYPVESSPWQYSSRRPVGYYPRHRGGWAPRRGRLMFRRPGDRVQRHYNAHIRVKSEVGRLDEREERFVGEYQVRNSRNGRTRAGAASKEYGEVEPKDAFYFEKSEVSDEAEDLTMGRFDDGTDDDGVDDFRVELAAYQQLRKKYRNS